MAISGQGDLQVPGGWMMGLVTKMIWGKDESLVGVVGTGLLNWRWCRLQ